MNAKPDLTLMRVVGPDLVAGFESDGTVRRAAPILKALVGTSAAEARELHQGEGWTARRRRNVALAELFGPLWGWSCGFYPGTSRRAPQRHRRDIRRGPGRFPCRLAGASSHAHGGGLRCLAPPARLD